MAKLYFYYSAMNAGKTTTLLQSAYNYEERGMRALLFIPKVDTRKEKQNTISSRIGLESSATAFDEAFDFYDYAAKEHQKAHINCILVDEAQFISKEQAIQLSDIADLLNIPVLAYGLRTDFQGELFPGSQYLLAWAEELIELKTICFCGRKATMTMRIDEQGHKVVKGSQVEIGGNDRYVAVCHHHYKEGITHLSSLTH